MVLAHYFREDGREEARTKMSAETIKALADAQAELGDLRKRIEALEARYGIKKVRVEPQVAKTWADIKAETENLNKRLNDIEAAGGKQADE